MAYINTYRVTHKGWDCKDDLKFFNYDDPKFKLSLMPCIWQSKKEVYSCGESRIKDNRDGI